MGIPGWESLGGNPWVLDADAIHDESEIETFDPAAGAAPAVNGVPIILAAPYCTSNVNWRVKDEKTAW